jgi:solute:Na+ symporter, SSS family
MALQVLQPGFLGLMMAGLLAANMSTIASQTMAVSALFTRNVYGYLVPDATPAQMVRTGRWAIVVILSIGVYAAANMDDVYAVVQLMLTVNVPFGAAVMLIFFWRKLTVSAVWATVVVSALLNIITPSLIAPKMASIASSPTLTQQVEYDHHPVPVFFDTIVRSNPEDPESPLVGQKRFHIELYVLSKLGLNVAALSPSGRNAARFVYDGVFPFIVLFAVSLFTKRPDQRRTDLFFGKMKTPVGADAALEDEAMAETSRNPGRFDGSKLFGPKSAWEFTHWNKVDSIGFIACLAVSFGILAAFWALLRAMAAG